MEYNQEDFTEKQYKIFLKMIRKKTIFFDEIEDSSNFLLWRHDIDFSVHRAYALAKIEKNENIKATYFIQFGSFIYNVFEDEIKELILKILSLGHQIGLHFDPTQYDIKTEIDLEKYLIFEKNILESLFKVDVKVFSFHNPTDDILKYDNFKYAGMVNTYSKYFKEKVEYCSDSNGYWRHKRLRDFLNKNYERMQVLTHPCWWQEYVMNPRDRIQRCIDGRAINCAIKYDSLLKKYGRENVTQS